MKRKLIKAKRVRVVHLCSGCIEMLKEYNPYLNRIVIVNVPIEKCDNYTVNGVFINLT